MLRLHVKFESLQKSKIPRSLPMELVVTNVLLLATPLDAMAETCETEQSLLSMNMPLLLLVALIGATVGGKVIFLGSVNGRMQLSSVVQFYSQFCVY